MRRVVVTGMGMVTPLGDGVDTNWRRLMAAESGIRSIQAFDTSDLATKIAGEVPLGDKANGHFNVDAYMPPKDQRKLDKFLVFGIAAAEQAVEDSGWKPQDDERPQPHRRDDRRGHRRPADDLRDLADPEGAGPAPGQPVLHSVGADQPRLRPGLDQVRLQGARTTPW